MTKKSQTADDHQLDPKKNDPIIPEGNPSEESIEKENEPVEMTADPETPDTPEIPTASIAEEIPEETELTGEPEQAEEIAPEAEAEEPLAEEAVIGQTTTEEQASQEEVPEDSPVEEPRLEVVTAEMVEAEETVVPEPVTETAATEEAAPEAPPESMPEEPETVIKEAPEAEPMVLDLHEIHDTPEEEEEEEAEEEEPVAEEKYDTYTREKLVETLEETVRENDVQKIKTRVALIKVAFLKLSKEAGQKAFQDYLSSGGEKEAYTPEEDALSLKFNQAFEIYRKNKAKYNEEQELLKLRNLDAKKQILDELKELINSDDNLKKTYDTFKDLQQKWKDIGLVPSAEINNLWQSYHFLVEKFFDKVKISKELRDLDLKKNFEKKIELCERAEELLLEPSIVKSFKQLQKYHEEWKEIGPVPQDKKEDIWERFKTATDKINERRREYYSKVTESQESNLLAKTVLCDKLESLTTEDALTIKDWQGKTNAVNELFKMWKSIGPAPRKENDEIWERFRTSLNAFFAAKKEYFGQIKQDQLNNYNIKLNIVRQAEAVKDSTDWKKTTLELINLQKEWKATGPVPRKYSDKIWKKFRAACDEFFERKSAYFSNVDEKEKENLDKKRDLIKRIEEYEFTQGRSEALEILKGFQREWTEIGHVPIREKDKLHESFRTAINKHLDNLNISTSEMRSMDYRAHVDHMKEAPNANWALRKEISALSTKVTKLREEIHLWENNIGFLAHSKRADLLKQEFEKKIEKAKEELAFSETKLRYLQQSLD